MLRKLIARLFEVRAVGAPANRETILEDVGSMLTKLHVEVRREPVGLSG